MKIIKLHQIFGTCALLLPSFQNTAHAEAAVAQKSSADVPVLNKWFALGSGCRSTPENPGDVQLERMPIDKNHPNTLRVKFHLPQFKHLVDENAKGKSSAKECALRINVNPPANLKVTNISVVTSIAVSKSADVELMTYAGLKIGVSNIGSAVSKYEKGAAVSNRIEDVMLIAGKKPDEIFPDLKCGEAKIIALDYTFMQKRENEKQTVSAMLGGDKVAAMTVDMAECK